MKFSLTVHNSKANLMKMFAKKSTESIASIVRREMNATFIHLPAEKHKGGATVCYTRDVDHDNCLMYNVSVAYCAEVDEYSRKIGASIAADRMYNGESIRMRVPAYTTPYAEFTRIFGQ